MKLSTFLLLNAALAVLDFAVTYGVESGMDTSVIMARSFGSVAAIASLILWANRPRISARNHTLPVVISIVMIAMNYGLFALLHSRNPVLNWHVLFAITTLAAFLLGAAGYHRARKKLTSHL